MNETMGSLLNRRSARSFRPEQLSEEVLDQIVEAGLSAPSAGNQQSWHFSVVQDKGMLDELSDSAKKTALDDGNEYFRQYAQNDKYHVFYNAPTAIIISGDSGSMMPEADCAAATENMLIAAESLGAAGCWLGFLTLAFQGSEAAENKRKLGIPEGHEPYYAIALGYRKGEKGKAPPRKENTVRFV